MRKVFDHDERGATAVMVAGAMLFLFGAAALAVDTSIFYGDARTDQNTADFACLAGVAEADSDDKIAMAAEFTRQNWPTMQGQAVTITGTAGTMSDGTSQVLYTTFVDGEAGKMRVQVLESANTHFARALGAGTVNIAQEATCEARLSQGGPGALPMGALAGTFSGDLFDCAAKVTGNCGAIRLNGSGANVFRDALAYGSPQDVEKHHGNQNTPDAQTGNVLTDCPTGGPCNHPETETGNMVGPFTQGMTIRLSHVAGADCIQNGNFNCDSLEQVLGADPNTLAEEFGNTAPNPFPSDYYQIQGWQPSLYGPYAAARDIQYYYNGGGIKCDSPRLGTIPIVVSTKGGSGMPNWDLGDAGTTWPNGNGDVKIIGFYSIYIREPANAGDGYGLVESDVIWFGPDATCDNGNPFSPTGSVPFSSGVKLVAP